MAALQKELDSKAASLSTMSAELDQRSEEVSELRKLVEAEKEKAGQVRPLFHFRNSHCDIAGRILWATVSTCLVGCL